MSRRGAAIGFALAIAIGGGSRVFPIGLHVWDKSVGDAAYATMIYFMVAFVRPAWRSPAVGALALALCEQRGIGRQAAKAPRLSVEVLVRSRVLAAYRRPRRSGSPDLGVFASWRLDSLDREQAS